LAEVPSIDETKAMQVAAVFRVGTDVLDHRIAVIKRGDIQM
jgi:hypothetical protein